MIEVLVDVMVVGWIVRARRTVYMCVELSTFVGEERWKSPLVVRFKLWRIAVVIEGHSTVCHTGRVEIDPVGFTCKSGTKEIRKSGATPEE